MAGQIFIRGNLYLTDDIWTSKLVENGITIHVSKDIFFLCKYEDIKSQMTEDDVFIENLLDKLPIKDVIAFSSLPIN